MGLDISKTLNLSGSAANYLLPREVVAGLIRDYVDDQGFFYNLVTKKPWPSYVYTIKKRLTLPTASWGTDGGPLPAATTSTYGDAQQTMKYIYTRGEVTGPAQAALGGAGFSAFSEEVELHTRAILQQLSYSIINGRGDYNDLYGIKYQTEEDTSMSGGVWTNQVIDKQGAALTFDMLNEAIDETASYGVIVASKAVQRRISAIAASLQRYNDRVEIAGGQRVTTWDGIPIVATNEFESDDELLFVDASRAILLEHQAFTFDYLAKTKDSDDFFIKGYFGFSLEGSSTLLKGFTLADEN